MATANSTIQIRINEKLKRESKKVFEAHGLDMSSALTLILRDVVATKSFPFEPRTENGYTVREEKMMLADAEEARKNGKRYTDLNELFKDLDLLP
jgi:DNA-damage-inducible protein J